MRRWIMLALLAMVVSGALVGCARKDGPGFRHDYRGGVESVD
jgi:hypothetical protein